MRLLGLDEAGRGPVLGPLVVGAFLIDAGAEASLWAAGARDSKRLSAARRVAVRAALEELGTWDVRVVSATDIDTGNLNRLEEDAVVDLVHAHAPDIVQLDALGAPRTLPALQARLSARCPGVTTWVIEPKADANHAAVASASIFAKTTRDAAMEALTDAWGALGSGYPSDPKTRAWLTRHAATGDDWPAFVRTRWSTIQQLAQRDLF